jgi:integrase
MAATLLANDTMVNTKLIGHLLGHASERTTNRYIHAKKSSLLEAVNMI